MLLRRCYPFPRSFRLLFIFAVVLLLITARCCQAEEDDPPEPEPDTPDETTTNATDRPMNMAHFACAKKDTTHSVFTQQDGRIAIKSEGIGDDTTVFGFMTNKNGDKMTIHIAVEDKCSETFERYVTIMLPDFKHCDKKPIDETSCPDIVPNCKFFEISCDVPMKAIADHPDAGAFKVKLSGLAALNNVCPWKGFIHDALLILASSEDPNGEPCVPRAGFFKLWMIIAMAVGGGILLLIVIVVVICVIRARNRPPPPQPGNSAFQLLSSWSMFGGGKSTTTQGGALPMNARTKTERTGIFDSMMSKTGATKGNSTVALGGSTFGKGTKMAGTTRAAGASAAGKSAAQTTKKSSSGAYGVLQ